MTIGGRPAGPTDGSRRSLTRELVRLAIGVLVGLALVVGYMTFRIASQGAVDERRPADAIVVLGAAEFDGRPSPVFEARLDHAISLYLSGIAPVLILTGGKLPGDRTTEAAAARAYAIARGVPAAAILYEDRGRNTLDSIDRVAAIFRARGYRSGVFVSDRPHMLRVLRMAEDDGITAWGSPTTTSPLERDPALEGRAIVHELAGLAAYYFGGGALIDESAINGTP